MPPEFDLASVLPDSTTFGTDQFSSDSTADFTQPDLPQPEPVSDAFDPSPTFDQAEDHSAFAGTGDPSGDQYDQ